MTCIREFSLMILHISHAMDPRHGQEFRVSVIHRLEELLAAQASPIPAPMMLVSRHGQGAPRQVAREIDAKPYRVSMSCGRFSPSHNIRSSLHKYLHNFNNKNLLGTSMDIHSEKKGMIEMEFIV